MNFTVAYFVLLVTFIPGVDLNSPSAFNASIRQERSRVQRQRLKRRPTPSNSDQSVTAIVRKIMKNYNKQEPPMADHATLVSLGIYVISFYSINEQTMDYSVSMYLRQSWIDPRLRFRTRPKKMGQIRLGDGMWKEIWIPDTFLRNEKAATFHLVTVENRLLQLNASGSLWYVTKITATLSCPMFLQKFPLDTQVCPMLFESFGYTMDTLYFQPLPPERGIPIEVAGDLQLPQFIFLRSDVHDCSQNYTTGAYPCLEFRFFLRRDLGYFLIQVYVPSILIVILSWVSFWINVDASPARVSIGLLTVLTTTTMSAGARSTLPRVSYIKAIDVWMIICLIFVFASLIEYAVVNVLSRKTAKPLPSQHARRKPPTTLSLNDNNSSHRPIPIQQMHQDHRNGPLQGTAAMETVRGPPVQGLPFQGAFSSMQGPNAQAPAPPQPLDTMDGRYRARRIDKLSRKFFPLAFLLFNIVYWIVYTMPSTVQKET